MTLNAVQIGEVLQEIRPTLEGCKCGSVFQPSRDVAVLVLERGETRFKLLFSMEWWGSRLHLVSSHLSRIKTPQPFFSALSRTLQAFVLREITQVNDDRIVEMRFVSDGEENERTFRIVVELMGPVSNVCLLDGEGKIKTMYRRNFAGRREFKPGDFYVHPQPPKSPGRASPADGLELEKFKEHPHPLSEALHARYEVLARERIQEEQQRRMLERLRGARKKRLRKIEAIEKEHRESLEFEREYQLGEILKANLDKIPPRAGKVTMDDLYGEGQVTIPLDEKLPPVENMERQFRRARKMKAALPLIKTRLERSRRELEALEAALKKAERGELSEHEIPKSLPSKQLRPRKSKQKKRRFPGIQFLSWDGFSILVGRNNAENDKLTMQTARGNDIWMHVQHQTGSHVVVQMPRGKTLSLDTLLDAANLAIYFSKVREARKVPVDYTYKKYVRKMKKAEVGKVTYSNNKTIVISPDKDRLRRLLGKEA